MILLLTVLEHSHVDGLKLRSPPRVCPAAVCAREAMRSLDGQDLQPMDAGHRVKVLPTTLQGDHNAPYPTAPEPPDFHPPPTLSPLARVFDRGG